MTPRETELTEQLAAARQEISLLRQKIDWLVRRVFGSSSEALDPKQLELLLKLSPASAPAESTPVIAPKHEVKAPSRKPSAPRLPEHLPVVEEVIEPEPVKQQPEHWRCIGQEVSEQLDFEPARFLRRRTIRKKYVHRTKVDAAPVIAPLPARLQDRSLPAPGLLAHILVAKYCDHLPLYRQEQIFARRHQVHLPRQTLARWVELAADWLQPIYEQIRTGVLAGGYVQVDETPIDYLEPGNGKTKQGYFWTASRPKGDVFFRWATSRATACLDQVMPRTFTGTLQSDGYPAYRAFVNGRKEVILHRCGQVGDALIDVYQRIEDYLNRVQRDYARARKLIRLCGLIERHEHLTATNLLEVAATATGPWFYEFRLRTLLSPSIIDGRPELLQRALARAGIGEVAGKVRRVEVNQEPLDDVPPFIDWQNVYEAFTKQQQDLFVFLCKVRVEGRPLTEEERIDGYCAIIANEDWAGAWDGRDFDLATDGEWEYAVVKPPALLTT